LRYTTEFFVALYDPSDVRPFLKQLKRLLDVFGYLNDVATAERIEIISEEHGFESRACQRAAGYVLGWHAAQADMRWAQVQEHWNELQRTSRFWR
jgi:CHAD domain-containing protein